MHETHNHLDAREARPCPARTFRAQRQRTRSRCAGDPNKSKPVGLGGEETMAAENTLEPDEPRAEDPIDRTTLCLPDFANDLILHGGDTGFDEALRKHFSSAESDASERIVTLKAQLKQASTHDFWTILMEGLCDAVGSQCGFVVRRMLVDDQDSAVEMPELGEPGSYLMGVAFYINNGTDVKEMHRDYRYYAYGTPCAHMKHDKVFIIPERMDEYIRDSPNALPWARSEAFIGVPLFSEGKSFAHFGMLWSSEGGSKRNLSWNFIEMMMHSLEDIILERILEGGGFAKEAAAPNSTSSKIIPLPAITASQSLKPYARSLSHELRTPMQGVVGMLDIMYATVLDAIEAQQSDRARDVFKDLKEHIEVVQDSSRRAVEAADNVVHAYDLNMQMPEIPFTPTDLANDRPVADNLTPLPFSICNSGLLSPVSRKHERAEDDDIHSRPLLKRMMTMTEAEHLSGYYAMDNLRTYSGGASITVTEKATSRKATSDDRPEQALSEGGSPILQSSVMNSAHRRIITRDFMRDLVTEALRSGHPISQVHNETDSGEIIEVKTINSRGEPQDQTIHLNIESEVPEVVITEEQHLQFSLQKVIDNALKFTESGSITINVKLSKISQVVEIWVIDTGCGIAEGSISSLFQPHFQEDASLSRSKDGLGLSLFNAKAHVRKKLGGDVTLERSATDGPSRGSEFLIRLPISSLGTENSDAPLIGTPTPTGRTGSWIESSPTGYFFTDANPILPGTLTGRPSPVRQPSRKTIPFNSKLARDYPLNILIAEDNAINRNVAVGSLNKLGYAKENITLAFDGTDAVQHYKASLELPESQRFDAVLMDIWMPNMDGYEATSQIMNLGKELGQETTIIAVTADITGDSVDRAKEAGMQGFLAKPYKVLDIENLIIEHFGERFERDV